MLFLATGVGKAESTNLTSLSFAIFKTSAAVIAMRISSEYKNGKNL